jgi:phosphate transport system ATP-binding protein
MQLNPIIEFSRFSVTIDGTPILRQITLEIPRNGITVIIGPSGCGKSTFLRSINRMNDLVEGLTYEGKLCIDGHSILDPGVDATDLRRRVGMIAQTPNPLPMSIYDNVGYGPFIHGLRDRREMDRVVRRSLERVGLWNEVSGRLGDPARNLSVGQQQRLCLARAIANGPEILLCDETTSALDPLSARTIEEELKSLSGDYTILFVTHILRQARRLADFAIFMYLGEAVEWGPAGQVFSHPSDPRTRQYLEGVL